jgi:predicted TIM-barrel fold metal-dependent hydrolase
LIKRTVKIDLHIHLAGTGCNRSGCWIAPRFERRYTFILLRWFYGIDRTQMYRSVDRDWVEKIAALIAESELDYSVVLGFDAAYERETGAVDLSRSQLKVPDAWVFRVCRNTPGLLPGPSINPYANNARQRLERAISQGAVLLKWLPAAQAIDPADARHSDFYRLMAEARLPLLVHMGGERTFDSVAPDFNDVSRLRLPLELGVTVICAHSATPLLFNREPDQRATLTRLLSEYPNLWLDNSGLTNPSRFHHVARLARDPLIEARTLYGSDWPVPCSASLFLPWIGIPKTLELAHIKNASRRDIAIKRYLGYSDATLTRAYGLLPNLDRWIRA